MNVFAYGTLMDADIMKHVSGIAERGKNAVLRGYRRYKVHGEQYPGIICENGGEVEGILYSDISDEALRNLDIFEGEMYSREKVQVVLNREAGNVEAMVYVVKPEHADKLIKKPWDFDHFLENGKQLFEDHYCGFDELQGK